MNQDETFLSMLSSHGAALQRIARVYGAATGEEEDLHQEMLLQLWRSLPSYRGQSAPGTWLYRVALNTGMAWRRSERRKRPGDENVPPPPAVTPPAARSQASILEEFLGTLGATDRSVLLLCMEALSYQQIADVTGLSAGAVGVRVHRLRRRFEDTYVEG